PALLHIMQRAGHLGAGTDVILDLHSASHLDPEVLLQLRSIAAASVAPALDPAAHKSADGDEAELFRLTLAEPTELPICLLHVGADGVVLAGLEGRLPVIHLLDVAGSHADDAVGVSPKVPAPSGNGQKNPGPGEGSNPISGTPDTIDGLELSEYFEGTLDPAATVLALSDAALGQLADALYRHLDTDSPAFGAHTWYELAAEELQNRKLSGAGGSSETELAAGQAIA
ncbi:MAG TPA: hypothetical protein VLT34_04715, partial [Arthrobacter sp.]|nr:hypothetical protein [Arthrobacter sp.]